MKYIFDTLSMYFSDPVLSGVLIRALVVGVPIALCAALLGVTLVLKRYSMIGDGLSHVGFGALAVATALGLGGEAGVYSTSTLLISLPSVIIAAFLMLRLSQSSEIKGDAVIALVSTGAIAVGYIIFSLSGNGAAADVCSSLFGKSSVISIDDIAVPISLALSVAVIALYVFSYTRIFSVTFDESFSKATGVRVNTYNTLLAVLTAVTIVMGMQLIGAVMISGMIVFPTLSAMRVASSFKRVVILSAVISVLSYIVGFFIAAVYGLPTGPSVICVNIAVFIVASVISLISGHKNSTAN